MKLDWLRRGVDKLKEVGGKMYVPPPDAKLRSYKVTLKLSVQATKKTVVKEAIRKMQGELPEWAPLLLKTLGVSDKMKINAIEAEF